MALPPAGSRADDKLAVGLCDFLCAADVGAVGGVFPVEQDGVFWDLGKDFGVGEYDVGPDVEAFSVFFGEAAELENEVEIEFSLADFLCAFFAASFSEFPGFIAAGVEFSGFEEGEVFIVEVGNEFEGCGGGGAECRAAPGAFGSGFFAEVGVLRECEDAFHVSEAGEGRNKGDVVFFAVVLEVEDVFGCEGAEAFVYLGVGLEGKYVFDVELEFVDFYGSEVFDEGFECLDGGDFSAAAVEVDAASLEVGCVFDAAAGYCVSVDVEHFPEGLDGVVGACVGGGSDFDAFWSDVEAVSFGVGDFCVSFDAEVGVPDSVDLDAWLDAGLVDAEVIFELV